MKSQHFYFVINRPIFTRAYLQFANLISFKTAKSPGTRRKWKNRVHDIRCYEWRRRRVLVFFRSRTRVSSKTAPRSPKQTINDDSV